jgi:PhoPQ-activated pathogenicity-related protein
MKIPMKRRPIISLIILLTLSGCAVKKNLTTPENALHNYLENNDKSYSWEIKERFSTEGANIAVIKLISQNWRDIPWAHQLTVISPSEINTDGALLFINGGSLKNGEPNWKGQNDGTINMMAALALRNKAVVAVISQVPNQPLYDGLTEDELISYTLHNFKNDRDFSWPLLFPMTKSAISAMDAVQEFASRELKKEIKRFVVSGASKRGWTTWLTGSQDPRVVAIAPMVIDVLNMPVNINYQKEVWGDYSVQIEDYVKLGIAQDLGSAAGKDLAVMIDPYSYRSNLAMPKMIIMGTKDEYWPADAVKHYLYGIPGDNYLHYEPNVGHDMGDKKGVISALSAFFNTVIYNKPQSLCEWQVTSDTALTRLTIKASPNIVKATLWSCESPDQDFRNDTFIKNDFGIDDPSKIIIGIHHPKSGYKAFYVELTYPDPVDGTYSKTTRMFVADDDELFLN